MKRIVSMVAMVCIALSSTAQSTQETDTIKVGNFVIIKRKGPKKAQMVLQEPIATITIYCVWNVGQPSVKI